MVDCFLADDIPLAGDTFVPTEATHTITVRYVDQLTYDNMTWGRYTYESEWWGNAAWLDFNTCIAKGVGQGTDWALSFDVTGGYDPNADTNQLFNAAVMIGTEHIIEFQVNHYSDSVCKWYGEGAWEDVVAVLSGEVVERFAQASPEIRPTCLPFAAAATSICMWMNFLSARPLSVTNRFGESGSAMPRVRRKRE